MLIMKDRTYIIRQSPGNSYRFPMDNNPSFSLSLFLPISREGSGHENASAGIKQKVRQFFEPRTKAKMLPFTGPAFHVGVFVPVRRRP